MGTDCSTCCTTKGEANNEINDTTGASDADSRFGTRSKPTTQKNVSGKAADDSKIKGGVSFLEPLKFNRKNRKWTRLCLFAECKRELEAS